MKIGILGAMSEEIKSLVANMSDVVQVNRAGTVVYDGLLKNIPVCVIQCGVGKTAAAAMTQLLISEFHITHAINTGLAGGLAKNIKVGDVVLSQQAEYYDVTASVLEENFPSHGVYSADKGLLGTAQRAAEALSLSEITHTGSVTTGDRFITQSAEKKWLLSITTAMCNDMEGAAIAQTCFVNDIPFLIVRIISDLADDSANDTYFDFKHSAPKLCNDIIMKMLELISL